MKTYTLKKTQATLVTRPGNGVAYSIQAPGPHGPGYRLAGSPVSCRQLENDAGSVGKRRKPLDFRPINCRI